MSTVETAFVRVAWSFLCAGVSSVAWLAAFLLTVDAGSSVVDAIRWLLAPAPTAAGFAADIPLYERVTGAGQLRFVASCHGP